MSSLAVPFLFRPKSCPVPVLPATSTGKPLNTLAAVPLVATDRSAFLKNEVSAGVCSEWPTISDLYYFNTLPVGLTKARAIHGFQSVPPFPIAA